MTQAPGAPSRTSPADPRDGGAALRPLWQGRVAEEEIDPLGHMNVRFYLDKALRATAALAAAHGLDERSCREHDAVLGVTDVFTRHHREQLAGEPLAVRGGVLAVDGSGLRLYHELVNTDRDERAAAFVHELRLQQRRTRAVLPIPEIVARSAADALVAWPAHGRPRTLDLARTPAALPLAEARARGIAMREVRAVLAEECDADGVFLADRYQDLFWGGAPLDGRPQGPPVIEPGDGRRLGWATLESRGLLLELPRIGARIQSFGAEVEIGSKVSVRHHWVFDVERDVLLCISSIVNLAFDLGSRRATEIPPSLRAQLEARYHPDLR